MALRPKPTILGLVIPYPSSDRGQTFAGDHSDPPEQHQAVHKIGFRNTARVAPIPRLGRSGAPGAWITE